MNYLMVALGGAVGAPLRYLVDRRVQRRHPSPFPWGIFLVNVVGCLILGFMAGFGLAGDDRVQLLIGTGFCGALTTYSTFAYETVWLFQQRDRRLAVLNVVGSVGVGVLAASLGFVLSAGVIR